LDLPNINQKIELKVLHGSFAAAYSTYVEDVDNDSLVVVRPTVGGELIALTPGAAVRVEFAIKGSARIAFHTRVLSMAVRGLPVLILAPPEKGQVERFQQRDFVRLEDAVPLDYTILYSPDPSLRRPGKLKTHTRDISGNGAQILCPESYAPGTQLDINLDVGGKSLHAVAEVIRTVDQAKGSECWVGIRFVGMDERTRDQIIRYIFNVQRERRRLGLL
jgi:c-di-GMP-binding flagellar brake protein YcgR